MNSVICCQNTARRTLGCRRIARRLVVKTKLHIVDTGRGMTTAQILKIRNGWK